MAALNHLTLAQARDGLKAKKFSAKELTVAHNAAIEKHKDLNAYITATPDIALEMAARADANIAKGMAGALEGIPVAVKDLFCTKGTLTTAASHILDGFKPAYESTITERLWNAGAVMLGKTNLDEFAMGSSNKTSYYGPAKNPWRRISSPLQGEGEFNLTPGGSSGGSAAAVAAFLAPAALGTDTGGSIRQPAAFCGIVGIKPTYGRCSRWGVIAFASSLDQPGPFTRTVQDAAIMLDVMCGYDAKDSTSIKQDVPNFEAALNGDVRGKTVGVPKEYRLEGTDPEIIKLWDDGIAMLKDAGMKVVEITLPHTKYALPTYYVLAPAECSSNLARYDGVRFGLRVTGEKGTLDEMYELTRAAGFGDEVKRRILIGTYVLSAGYYDAYYKKAQKVRRLICNDFTEAFKKCDAILTPTAPSAAFALDEKITDHVTMYLNDVFTVPASLAGLPGLSLPMRLNKDGLPLGLQLIGNSFDEATVLTIATALEKSAQFTCQPYRGSL